MTTFLGVGEIPDQQTVGGLPNAMLANYYYYYIVPLRATTYGELFRQNLSLTLLFYKKIPVHIQLP